MQSGTLGQVFMVRRRHGLAVHTWKGFAQMWHNDPALNRDIWADDAAHAIDFLHWLLGVPETVTAELATIHDPRVPNDNGVAIFRYPDGGPLAEVVCSFTCPAAENTTEVRRVYHLDRGYERIEAKLSGLGAAIERVKGARG